MREMYGPAADGAAAGTDDQVCRGRQPDTTRGDVAPVARDGGPLGRLRWQRQVEQVHRLGPRAIAELLNELARHHGIGEDIDRRLAAYAAVDLHVLAAVGGDQFPVLPIRLVEGDDG